MKVTVFVVIIFVITSLACKQVETREDELAFQQKVDSAASKKIDSAYKAITQNCDTAMRYRIPVMVDSLVKLNTTSVMLSVVWFLGRFPSGRAFRSKSSPFLRHGCGLFTSIPNAKRHFINTITLVPNTQLQNE